MMELIREEEKENIRPDVVIEVLEEKRDHSRVRSQSKTIAESNKFQPELKNPFRRASTLTMTSTVNRTPKPKSVTSSISSTPGQVSAADAGELGCCKWCPMSMPTYCTSAKPNKNVAKRAK